MNGLTVGLLAVGVTGAIVRPPRIPPWSIPVGCAVLVVAAGLLPVADARDALATLGPPIAFLLAAIPLAVLLDELGFFSTLAARLGAAGHGSGALWILAAVVTTVLNLDTAVVLLTPLYVNVARHTGRDPLVLAFQPVLLACLASSALPVSNLTNLIAVEHTGARPTDFLVHLGLPSLVAVTVGWLRYRQVLAPDAATPAATPTPGVATHDVLVPASGAAAPRDMSPGGPPHEPGGPLRDPTDHEPATPGDLTDREPATPDGPTDGTGPAPPAETAEADGPSHDATTGEPATPGDAPARGGPAGAHPRALALGGAVVLVVVVGFVVGPAYHVHPWVVALAADVVLVGLVQRVPWRQVPYETALVAGSLAVLAAAAVAGVPLDRVIGGDGTTALAGTIALTALGTNVVNNLPALLVALPAVGDQPSPALWATLVGVNMGPVVLVTGSLASLLWLDSLHRLGVPVHPRTFTRVGLAVGAPAALAGAATFLGLVALG